MCKVFDECGSTPACPVEKVGHNSDPGTIGQVSQPLTVDLHGFAHGGEAVGRLPDGRVVFVGYGIPGETVTVRLTEEHERWCRGSLVDVVEPSPDRVAPPCPYFGVNQCGGCSLQHIAAERRRTLLRQVVVDQIERLGKIPDPPVAPTRAAGEYGYRNRARFGVTATGALGFRRAGSTDVLVIDRCLLLDDATQRVREEAGDAFAGAAEVEVRSAVHGAAVVVNPGPQQQVTHNEPMTERIAGMDFAVSASSFFQANRAGAEVLVELVVAGARIATGDTALDLYSGVGLFARALADGGAATTAVEGAPSSVDDARRNLALDAKVVAGSVRKVVPRLRREGAQFDVVVLDPPRSGAGRDVIDGVAALARRTIVLVACDAAALGRDAGTLTRQGWHLRLVTPVDQFAQTGHVEAVAVFDRVE